MPRHLIHAHSSVVTEGEPKLPAASRLEYGEIAVNFANGHETLSIKNSNDDIVTFSSDNKLYDVIIENERTIATALNDMNDRISNNMDAVDDLETSIENQLEGKLDKMVSITYSSLKSKRDNSQLIPGQMYRITDYVTTTTYQNTRSAGYPFDIIVTATDTNKLNENAKAIVHSGDTYFTGYSANLEAWEIKYTLDNDNTKFAWADTTNGKGVIYYMKDEWGNECPYDFKNILFATDMTNVDTKDILSDDYFTFSWIDNNSNIKDATLAAQTLSNDENHVPGVHNNIIRECNGAYYAKDAKYILPANVFADNYGFDEKTYFYGMYGNYIDVDSAGNIITNSNRVRIGHGSGGNTIGDGCWDITIGYTSIKNNVYRQCENVQIGYSSSRNIIPPYNQYITIGNNSSNNSIGSWCSYITIGNNCKGIDSFPSYSKNFIVEDNNQTIGFNPADNTDENNYYNGVKITFMTNVDANNQKLINLTIQNATYPTIYMNNATDTQRV